MKNYETFIGLEVHVELNTKTKIFCGCGTKFGMKPNTQVCPVCMGMPGTLPVLNKKVVEHAVSVGLATNCKISGITKFDRKNYFYPDNPQNYQISQLYLPICHDGFVEIETEEGKKTVGIHEIHMEEDAGKLLHDEESGSSLVDYNRAGVPLIEIVSEPHMRNADDVIAYLEKLRLIIKYLGASDCKLNEGSMRADVNLSVRAEGETKLGTRTEMKNLNSFKAIRRAIEDERNRQIEMLERGEEVILETRRWDDEKGCSYPMRSKEDSKDYRYFPEPDLLPVMVSEEEIYRLKENQPEFREAKIKRYVEQFEIPQYDAEIITLYPNLSKIFEETTDICKKPKKVSNWILGEVMRIGKEKALDPDELNVFPLNLSKLIDMCEKGIINNNTAKEVFVSTFETGQDPEEYVKINNLSMSSDENELLIIAEKVLMENEQSVTDYKNGKDKALGFLVGQMMKATKGKGNPAMVNDILKKILVMVFIIILVTTQIETSFANPTHGTTDVWIREEQLNNTPPADYKVNEATQGYAKDQVYNKYFLDDDLQEVRISIDENNLNYLLQNAKSAPYVMAESVVIGDTTIEYPGLKTKGDYTLVHSYDYNAGSDRFSFTINFGKYINKSDYGEKQNFYGCQKISFNNFFFDISMLKEYVSYKLFDEMGVPIPQYGLAKLYINNQYYGVYFMVETFDETIIEQHFNEKDVDGLLGKPRDTTLSYEELKKNPALICDNDAEELKDYEEMVPTMLEWSRKITNLSNGKDFEGNVIDVNGERYLELLGQIMDIDSCVKYFATHSWLCQNDSMFAWYKNYGLYIGEDGVSTIIPWDYDLSFGGYGSLTSFETANFDVDRMYVDGGGSASLLTLQATYKRFPLFNVIYQNKELMAKYYQYMNDCSNIAALGGYATSSGKTYEPAYFSKCIEKLEEELLSAAREDLAENVYYMNGARQPAFVKDAIPNLKNIIAMRAIGVKHQLDNSDYKVTTQGCDLAMVGNGMAGETATGGNLTIIDESTGIYVSAEYNDDKVAPYLDVITLENTNALHTYRLESNKTATGKYQINIPATREMLEAKTLVFYYKTSEDVVELEMTKKDNIYTCIVDSLGSLGIYNNYNEDEKATKIDAGMVVISVTSVVFEIVLILVVCVAIVKKKKNIVVAVFLCMVIVTIVLLLSALNVKKEITYECNTTGNDLNFLVENQKDTEILQGKSWWKNYENSKSYVLTGDGTYTFDVAVDEKNPENTAFCVEIYDELGNYFTTTSEGDYWYAGTDGTSTKSTEAISLKPGNKVKVVVSRKENTYTFEYIDSKTDKVMQKIVAVENGKFAKVLKVRIMAQIGTFYVDKQENK